MSEEQSPGPPARDPDPQVIAFLDGFAAWIVDDVGPAISAQTERLRELIPALRDAREVTDVVAHLDVLTAQLDALVAAIAVRDPAAGGSAVESLAGVAADRCNEARALMARARLVLGNRPDGCGRPPTGNGCLRPE